MEHKTINGHAVVNKGKAVSVRHQRKGYLPAFGVTRLVACRTVARTERSRRLGRDTEDTYQRSRRR